jgi:hypothetical protein
VTTATAVKASMYSDRKLLRMLADDAGCSVLELLEQCTYDSVAPGICTDCQNIVDNCEPDADANWCDECCSNTIKSALVLGGVL